MAAPHEILQISMNASKKEARAAWKRLVSEHHPDRHPPHLRASKSRKMMLINVAYEEFCEPDYLKKQSQRHAGRAKSTTAESRQKPLTKHTHSFDAKSAKHILDAIRPAENDSFPHTSPYVQKNAWKHLFMNMLRLKFRFGKTLPILAIVPHRFLLEVENRHLIVFSGCYAVKIPSFFFVDGFNFKDAGNIRREIPHEVFAFDPDDHDPPHATPYGLKVAEFDSSSPHLNRITVIYERDSAEGELGPRTHRMFLRPRNGLLRFYWKRVYYSDTEAEAGVRPDF